MEPQTATVVRFTAGQWPMLLFSHFKHAFAQKRLPDYGILIEL
jgi:hypothetical protein